MLTENARGKCADNTARCTKQSSRGRCSGATPRPLRLQDASSMSPASSRQEPVDPGTGEAWPRGAPRRPQPHVPAPWAPAPRGLTPASPGELAVNLCYGRGVAEQWRASSASTGPARWMTAPWLQEHPPPCPPTSLSRQHQPAIPVESSQVPGSEGTEVPEALASVFGERPQSWRCARRTGSPPPQLTFQHRDGQCPSSWDAMPRLLPVCMARPPETA